MASIMRHLTNWHSRYGKESFRSAKSFAISVVKTLAARLSGLDNKMVSLICVQMSRYCQLATTRLVLQLMSVSRLRQAHHRTGPYVLGASMAQRNLVSKITL